MTAPEPPNDSCDVPGCDKRAQWYVHTEPEPKWCARHGADCCVCGGTRLVYGPCDCIERFGFHEQGRCPGSWKVPCPECASG